MVGLTIYFTFWFYLIILVLDLESGAAISGVTWPFQGGNFGLEFLDFYLEVKHGPLEGVFVKILGG